MNKKKSTLELEQFQLLLRAAVDDRLAAAGLLPLAATTTAGSTAPWHQEYTSCWDPPGPRRLEPEPDGGRTGWSTLPPAVVLWKAGNQVVVEVVVLVLIRYGG